VAFTAIAEQRALEIVLEHPVALAVLAAEVEDFLYAIEEFLVDDRFVSACVNLALIDDAADVVEVAQHAVQPFESDGSLREPPGRTRSQSQVGRETASNRCDTARPVRRATAFDLDF